MTTSLGTGVFTLHKNFMRIGLVNATILLLIVGSLLIYSSKLVIFASKSNPECHSLPDLVEKLFGKAMKIIYNLIFVFYLLIMGIGGYLAFNKTLYSNFEETIWKMFPVSKENQNFLYFNKYMIWLVGMLSFIIVVQRNLDKLSYFSMICFLIYFLLIILVVIQTPSYYNHYSEDNVSYFKWDFPGIILAVGIFLSAMSNIVQFYGVNSSIYDPSSRRLMKVFVRGMGVLSFMYLVAGLCAYLSLKNIESSK